MKTTLADLIQRLEGQLAQFRSHGEDLNADHEFIANFVGMDHVLTPAFERLAANGFHGDRPDASGSIYMHVVRPLTTDGILDLAKEADAIATETGCTFELLDVTLQTGPLAGHCMILAVRDGEALTDAQTY